MLRVVYALFLQSRVVLMVMVMFILGQVASMFISARFSFRTNQYTATCLLVRSNPGNAFFRYAGHVLSLLLGVCANLDDAVVRRR